MTRDLLRRAAELLQNVQFDASDEDGAKGDCLVCMGWLRHDPDCELDTLVRDIRTYLDTTPEE